ncbi:histidine kinase [Nonomuraea sp. NPDC049028]|uniref:histidine kinase n=1 Tax=Nonomuraea sp. NPDC049028 TaxID=3364348 RepID=UPI0037145061
MVGLSAAVFLRWARLPRPERDAAVTFSGLLVMLLVLALEAENLAQAGGLAVYFTGELLDSLVVLGFIVWPLAYRVVLGRREAARRMAGLLDAGDEARRRIERDLHDGAQQRLVNVRLLLGLARDEPARLDQAVQDPYFPRGITLGTGFASLTKPLGRQRMSPSRREACGRAGQRPLS